MPAAAPARPRFDRVENARVTAEGYRRLAELSRTPEGRRQMLGHAEAWTRRAEAYQQEDLAFGGPLRSVSPEPNPCRTLYGPGPAGQRCAACGLLRTHTPGKRTYYKCPLRTFTRSARSDHRLGWPACSRFEPRG